MSYPLIQGATVCDPQYDHHPIRYGARGRELCQQRLDRGEARNVIKAVDDQQRPPSCLGELSGRPREQVGGTAGAAR